VRTFACKTISGAKKKLKPSLFFIYGIIIFMCLLNVFPIFNFTLNSFRLHHNIISKPLAFDVFTLQNYVRAQKFTDLYAGMFNAVYISFWSIIVLVLVGSLAAYALVFIKNRLTKYIYPALVLGYFIPPASVLINGFLTLRGLNLLNSYSGIVLMYAALYIPITVILLFGYMKTLPYELVESAQIDGAGHLTIFRKIMLPLSKSILVTLTILLFLWTYRDFMWPLILMSRPAKRTISVALAMYSDDRQNDIGVMSAAVMISLIPIVATYGVLKEKIMAGMTAGAIKG
jgi:raffinose/stachyose/melibiose transport system permease protein